MTNILVPVGWDAMRGEPQFTLAFPQPGTEHMVSDTIWARRERIWGPLQLASHLAVTTAMKRAHDQDEARYHRLRPALKECPYDPACRFL